MINKVLKIIQNYNVIAVTGKMASGKNYICSQLEAFSWKSIDADILVHKAICDSSELIYNTFKKDAQLANINILNNDNSINRKALGELLFLKPELLKKQEQIVYPIITEKIQHFIENNEKAIINATVLYKTPELLNQCECILYISSNPVKRILRSHKRDKLPFKQIIKRLNAQKNLYQKYKTIFKNIYIVHN